MYFVLCVFLALSLISWMFYLGYKTSFCYRWWLYLAFAAVLSSDVLFCNRGYSAFEIAISVTLGASLAVLIYMFTSFPIFGKRWLKIILCILDVVLLSVTIVPQVIRISMGISYFNEECFIVLLQSNIKESFLFIYNNVSLLSFSGIFVVILAIVVLSLRSQVLVLEYSRIILIGVWCLFSLVVSMYLSSGIHYAQIYIDNYYRKVAYLKRNTNVDYSIFSDPKCDSLTFVIIIGESCSRNYMSAYGYKNKTTPNIEKIISVGDFLQFKHAYSPDIKTVDCIPKALTSQSQFCESMDYLLFNLLRSKGFFTAWIGNQAGSGFNDNPVVVLSSCADFRVFSEDVKGEDMNLIPFVKKILKEKNKRKFIVLHLKGSHFPYDLSYPKDAACGLVKASTTLEHYENSLRYHDMFMGELMKVIKPYNNLICLYTSDHGEKPGVTRMNDTFDFAMVRIPFLVYFSSNIRNFGSYQILKDHVNNYWSNELLFNLVCGLAGIHNKEILPLNVDLSSNCYNLNKNSFVHQNGRFKMKNDTYK